MKHKRQNDFGFMVLGVWILLFSLLAIIATAEAGAVFAFASQILEIF